MTQDNVQDPHRGRKGFIGGTTGFFRWFARNRRIQVIFAVLVLSLPIFLLIYGIVVPVKNYKPSVGGADTTYVNESGTAGHSVASLNAEQKARVKSIIALENERAYQQNRLSLSSKDSIYLILDIPDSVLVLEIKGVPVSRNKFSAIRLSNRYSLISHENLLPWISVPFTLQRELATIPKMPITVKQAPKDTLEAAQSSNAPLPPDTTAVYFTLYFDRNLVIEVEQSEPAGEGDIDAVKKYRSAKRKESNRSVFQLLKNPAQADQPMTITLSLGEKEARAIYRAIPMESHLILKL